MSGPSRIVFLRHAEEHGAPGVTEDGTPDEASLTIRGWQRAGALCRLLCGADGAGLPEAVFASAIAPGSETKRPQQTAKPFVAMLSQKTSVEYVTRWAKGQVEDLMADVMRRSGSVAVVWEHSRLGDCVAELPGLAGSVGEWPKHRYDLIWVCERTDDGWHLTPRAQMILPGDCEV